LRELFDGIGAAQPASREGANGWRKAPAQSLFGVALALCGASRQLYGRLRNGRRHSLRLAAERLQQVQRAHFGRAFKVIQIVRAA
jgi:hypothetical protein